MKSTARDIIKQKGVALRRLCPVGIAAVLVLSASAGATHAQILRSPAASVTNPKKLDIQYAGNFGIIISSKAVSVTFADSDNNELDFYHAKGAYAADGMSRGYYETGNLDLPGSSTSSSVGTLSYLGSIFPDAAHASAFASATAKRLASKGFHSVGTGNTYLYRTHFTSTSGITSGTTFFDTYQIFAVQNVVVELYTDIMTRTPAVPTSAQTATANKSLATMTHEAVTAAGGTTSSATTSSIKVQDFELDHQAGKTFKRTATLRSGELGEAVLLLALHGNTSQKPTAVLTVRNGTQTVATRSLSWVQNNTANGTTTASLSAPFRYTTHATVHLTMTVTAKQGSAAPVSATLHVTIKGK